MSPRLASESLEAIVIQEARKRRVPRPDNFARRALANYGECKHWMQYWNVDDWKNIEWREWAAGRKVLDPCGRIREVIREHISCGRPNLPQWYPGRGTPSVKSKYRDFDARIHP